MKMYNAKVTLVSKAEGRFEAAIKKAKLSDYKKSAKSKCYYYKFVKGGFINGKF